MKILALVSNGFEEMEALGTIALLKRSGIDVDICALHGTKASGKHNITICNLLPIEQKDDAKYDALLLPGGPHYKEMEESNLVQNTIKTFMKEEKLVCAICAAPTILGHAGYLKKRNYTCFTSMNEDFGGTYLDQYVVKDGNLITARSAAASISFAFAIIAALQGKEQEDKIKQEIYF